MFVIIPVLNSVFIPQMQSHNLHLTSVSQDNVSQVTVCANTVFQVHSNSSLMARGMNKYLFKNKEQLDFVYIHIDGVSQLYCNVDDQRLYLVFQNKSMFAETPTSTFELVLENVLQISGFFGITFVLTTSQLLVKGNCDSSRICGITPTGTYDVFTPIVLQEIDVQNIERIDFETQWSKFLFIYMKNGDSFALGDNAQNILPVKKLINSYQFLIGSNIKQVQVGINLQKQTPRGFYVKQSTAYYFEGKESVFAENVQNILIMISTYKEQEIIYIQNNQIKVFTEISEQSQNGTDVFCAKSNGAECQLVKQGEVVQCYDDTNNLLSNDYCAVFDCFQRLDTDNECAVPTSCGDNRKCQAISCLYGTNSNCYFNYQAATFTSFINASQMQFVNSYILQNLSSTPTPVKPAKNRTGLAVGLAVAGCFIVFIIVVTSMYFVHRRNLKKTEVKENVDDVKQLQRNDSVLVSSALQ
ncbi:Hypothetical_protein [Hexamita inflata]|uniref:Hypothetical_protein n=1 Tax=Hexamita inflata TaxID=28002 RepID=A0AA86UKD0_9EUKA|nr:Hypothetical protein HINF_LOCUS42496 [Hexamita inflata]